MKKLSFHQWALVFALLMLVITLALVVTGNGNNAGLFLIAFFISLSYGVKAFQATKGLSFTMWMFTAVTAAMYFPQLFVSYGDFQFKRLITPLLQIIMFGMGAQMSLNDFTGVIKMPKGVAIGVIGHYTIMPVMAFLITAVFDFPPEIAAGIILAGCVPSGLASNVMSLLANANLALAVTIGATTTILAPFVTPFLMKIIGGQFVAIDVWKMMLDIFEMMILPIIAGFIFNLYNIGKADRRSKTIQMLSYFIIILLANIIYMKVHNTDISGYLKQSAVSLSIFFVLPVQIGRASCRERV